MGLIRRSAPGGTSGLGRSAATAGAIRTAAARALTAVWAFRAPLPLSVLRAPLPEEGTLLDLGWLVVEVKFDRLDWIRNHDVFLQAGRFQVLLGSCPGLENILEVLKVGNLWNPRPDVGALLIVVKCLLHRVEDSSCAARVVPHTGYVLPVGPVGGHIIVHEQHLVPLCAIPPVDLHVLCEEASDVLPSPVGCVAGVQKLSLRCINEPHARCSCVKPGKDVRDLFRGRFLSRQRYARVGGFPPVLLVLPFVIGVLAIEALYAEELVAILLVAQPHVIAPQEFYSDGLRALVIPFAEPVSPLVSGVRSVFVGHQSVVDLASGDTSLRKVCRQLGAELRSEETISGVLVVLHASVHDEMIDSLMSRCFSASE